MIKPNDKMDGEVVWFRPMVRIELFEHGTTQQGNPTRSEEKARAQAARIGRSLLSAGIDGAWRVGIGRAFNRNTLPTHVAWADPHGTKPPPLPPLPPLTGPSRGG